MATPAQMAANRANAQKSTGPATEAGKAASSQNRRAHGFRSQFVLPQGEDFELFKQLRIAFYHEHDPQTTTECVLVDEMIEHHWMVRRARLLQMEQFNLQASPEHAATADTRFALYMRYEMQHDRAFHKALEQLRKLTGERRKNEIGFERAKQAEAAGQQRKQAEQDRKAAEERRKQEAHEAKMTAEKAKQEALESKTRLAHAKSDELELNTAVKAIMQAACPGNATLDFSVFKTAILEAIHSVNQQRVDAQSLSQAA